MDAAGPRRTDSPRRVDRHRDNRDRGRPVPYPKDDIFGSRPGGNKSPPYNRIFVSNIPYEEKWQAIKDLFREKVGEVTYVQLITDETGNSKGFGIVEFKTKELVQVAVEKMRAYEIKDRKLVVKEDSYGDFLRKAMRRDTMNCPAPRGGGNRFMMPPPPQMPRQDFPPLMSGPVPAKMQPQMPPNFNQQRKPHIPAIPVSFEEKIQKISGGGPIGNTVFVANLDYSVSYSKLKEVFSLAGNITKVDLHLDKDNKSRGMAAIKFETPMEALQAISMFNKQLLYDRPMLVKMDRDNFAELPKKELPSGLQGIGPSLNFNPVGWRDGQTQQRMDSSSVAELEMLAAKKKLLESGLGLNLSALGGIGNTQLSSDNFSGIPGLLKPSTSNNSFNMTSLGQQSSFSGGSALSNPSLIGALGALHGRSSDNNTLGSELGHGFASDDRSLSFGNQAIPGLRLSDRERIDIDIARVDNRIRDLDRSLKSAEDRMSSNGRSAESNSPSCTVFVSNIPYNLSWQGLREMFSRVGNVLFTNIKTEDGRSKGYGRVRFDSPEEAMMAVHRFNGVEIDGRSIGVRLDNEPAVFRH